METGTWKHQTIKTANGGKMIIGCGSDPCRCAQLGELFAEDRARSLAELEAELAATDDLPESPDDALERWLS